jgi:phosphate transport system protein
MAGGAFVRFNEKRLVSILTRPLSDVVLRSRPASPAASDSEPAGLTTMANHTIKAFDADLRDLKRRVAEMGGLVERQIVDEVDALTKSDMMLAQRVIAADDAVDKFQRSIERMGVEIIARRQPMAVDLREIVGALRISNDLERIGDLAKNIAKRLIALQGEAVPRRLIRGLIHMVELVLGQLKCVLDSYARLDVAAAVAVWKSDQEIDAITGSLFEELMGHMREDPQNINFGIHLLFCAKNIERKGDHATNIAEIVHYVVEGQVLHAARPKGDTTSLAVGSGDRLKRQRRPVLLDSADCAVALPLPAKLR